MGTGGAMYLNLKIMSLGYLQSALTGLREELDTVYTLIDNCQDETEMEELLERKDEIKYQMDCVRDEMYSTTSNY